MTMLFYIPTLTQILQSEEVKKNVKKKKILSPATSIKLPSARLSVISLESGVGELVGYRRKAIRNPIGLLKINIIHGHI